MPTSRRLAVAVGVFVVLGIVVAVGHWYEGRQAQPRRSADKSSLVHVTNAGDRGPGTLREALFIAAAGKGPSNISIEVPRIEIETALPPLVNPHGVNVIAGPQGAQIDAHALAGGPVFDIAGANTSIEGISVVNCPTAGVLVRAVRFHLSGATIRGCDVAVEVAENASDTLLQHNVFTQSRLGVRFGASGHNTVVANNEFVADKDAGLWAVRGSADARDDVISIHDNKFSDNRAGIVAGNVPVLVERNEFTNASEANVHIVGAGAVIRGNRISGGASMGIVAENARDAVIEGNELDGLAAYGVMVRGSFNTLVRGNRLHNCGYGLAFVLGDPKGVSTAIENTIIEPKFNGIDVIGDSPVLRRNQVLRPHAYALHVEDFQPPNGQKVRSQPFLENNNFGNAAVARSSAAAAPDSQRR